MWNFFRYWHCAIATLSWSVAHCAAYQPFENRDDHRCRIFVSEKSIQAIGFFSFYCFCFLFIGIRHCLWKVLFLSLNTRQTMHVWNERKSMKLIRKKWQPSDMSHDENTSESISINGDARANMQFHFRSKLSINYAAVYTCERNEWLTNWALHVH